MFDRALKLAIEVNFNKTDSLDKPYSLFVLRVTQHFLHDLELSAIWLLHSVIDQSTYTLYDAGSIGFSKRVLRALDCLHRRKDEQYENYITRVCTNRDAVKVKIKIIKYNSSAAVLESFDYKDFLRLQEYRKAYVRLVEADNKQVE